MKLDSREKFVKILAMLGSIFGLLLVLGFFLKPSQPESAYQKLDLEIWCEQSPASITFYIHNKGPNLHDVSFTAKGIYWDEIIGEGSWNLHKEYGNIPEDVTAIITFSPEYPAYSWSDCYGFPFNRFEVTVQCREGTHTTTLS